MTAVADHRQPDLFASVLGRGRGHIAKARPLPMVTTPAAPIAAVPRPAAGTQAEAVAAFERWSALGPDTRVKEASEALNTVLAHWTAESFEEERQRMLHVLSVAPRHPECFDRNGLRAAQPNDKLTARMTRYVRAAHRSHDQKNKPFTYTAARVVAVERILREHFGELAVEATLPWRTSDDEQLITRLQALVGERLCEQLADKVTAWRAPRGRLRDSSYRVLRQPAHHGMWARLAAKHAAGVSDAKLRASLRLTFRKSVQTATRKRLSPL